MNKEVVSNKASVHGFYGDIRNNILVRWLYPSYIEKGCMTPDWIYWIITGDSVTNFEFTQFLPSVVCHEFVIKGSSNIRSVRKSYLIRRLNGSVYKLINDFGVRHF